MAEAEPKPTPKHKTPLPPNPSNNQKDFLLHLESYLARRDGIDKLLKIARYAAKIAISSSLPPQTLKSRLNTFQSSIGLSRKAFRLGKFVQDVNSLRAAAARPISAVDILLSVAAYGGEGLYYFLEQIVWLSKSGILSPELARRCERVGAWAELVGYVGSVVIKVKEVRRIKDDIEDADHVEVEKLRLKLLLKQLSLVQDFADGLMVVGDLRDGKGFLTDPLLMASAGMLSALISTHKNWTSC